MVQNTLERADEQTQQVTSPCAHYWVLGGSVADEITGQCRYCGKQRRFSGGGGDTVREEERHADMDYWGVGDLKGMKENPAA